MSVEVQLSMNQPYRLRLIDKSLGNECAFCLAGGVRRVSHPSRNEAGVSRDWRHEPYVQFPCSLLRQIPVMI